MGLPFSFEVARLGEGGWERRMSDEAGKKSTEQYELRDTVCSRQSERLLKPAGCRSYLRRRLARVFPAIVEGFLEEAKKGSCVHLKLATELLGPVRKRASRRKGSVTKLLERLQED
jgi:hypothetical protein